MDRRVAKAKQAADYFLKALAGVRPEILADLRDNVKPTETTRVGSVVTIHRRSSLDLNEWASRWGLSQSSPVKERAHSLVQSWSHGSPRSRQQLKVSAPDEWLGDWPSIPEKRSDPVAAIGANPHRESWSAFRAIAHQHYKARRSYDRDMLRREKVSPEHYLWLARRLYLGLSYKAIGKMEPKAEADAVRKSVEVAAEILQLNFPKGHPRKRKSKDL